MWLTCVMCDQGRLRRVPLGQVRKILHGQQTQVFSRNKGNPTAKGLEKMSMSLIYGHRSHKQHPTPQLTLNPGKKIERWMLCAKLKKFFISGIMP